MKKNYKVLSLLFLLSIYTLSINAQEYDCEDVNNKYRGDKNAWIVQDVDNPFSTSEISKFNGLFYYPVDCKYVFEGTLSPSPSLKVIKIPTTNGDCVQVYDYGRVSFKIDGESYNLIVYKNIEQPEFGHTPETLFIPFKDKTSGPKPKTTFADGRYLIIQPPASGKTVTLDFNMATNPFENYNGNYSTIDVPDQNVIMAPVPTGERKYEDRSD